MINTADFINWLRERGVTLFSGVPDSLLGGLSACLLEALSPKEHIIAANEGNAVGLATGHYLATGKPGVVYMQNSGLGNAVNPLTSLAMPEIYGIPMLLIVGWRGEPGRKDEPQHVKQGAITESQLALLGIPHWVIDGDSDACLVLEEAWSQMMQKHVPAALLVRAGTFGASEKSDAVVSGSSLLLREAAIKRLLTFLDPSDCVVATTGKTGRELFELRAINGEAQKDFLVVGGMGHASSIALGVALARPERKVFCLDGDGALLMHLGALPIIGDRKPANFVHVLLNNRAHESVGGQPTVAGNVDFKAVVLACGYRNYLAASTLTEIDASVATIMSRPGPHFLELHIATGSRVNLGRPTTTPAQNKHSFMSHLGVSP